MTLPKGVQGLPPAVLAIFTDTLREHRVLQEVSYYKKHRVVDAKGKARQDYMRDARSGNPVQFKRQKWQMDCPTCGSRNVPDLYVVEMEEGRCAPPCCAVCAMPLLAELLNSNRSPTGLWGLKVGEYIDRVPAKSDSRTTAAPMTESGVSDLTGPF
jgi:hypothetical protein